LGFVLVSACLLLELAYEHYRAVDASSQRMNPQKPAAYFLDHQKTPKEENYEKEYRSNSLGTYPCHR
jgi:hypothetical protein